MSEVRQDALITDVQPARPFRDCRRGGELEALSAHTVVNAKSYVLSPQQAAALRALCKRYLRRVERGENNGDGEFLAINVRRALHELSRKDQKGESAQSGVPSASTSGQR